MIQSTSKNSSARAELMNKSIFESEPPYHGPHVVRSMSGLYTARCWGKRKQQCPSVCPGELITSIFTSPKSKTSPSAYVPSRRLVAENQRGFRDGENGV